MAESDQQLQMLMDVVDDYCVKWRFELSSTKTRVVVFGHSGPMVQPQPGEEDEAVVETDEYKYLGLIFQRELTWAKAKDKMMRNARRASVWSWNMLMSSGNPPVKLLQETYFGLVRPYLEYGAEVWGDFEWKEAEALQRQVGKRILRVSKNTANEVVMGELGWLSLKGRRMMLRLNFWAKILQMPESRWVRRVYNESRRRLLTHPRRKNWCSYTRDCLERLGMLRLWGSEVLPGEWNIILRERIRQLEEREWLESMENKPKLVTYRRWKTKLEREPYLDLKDASARRALTELRSGTNKLRVDTGRWELYPSELSGPEATGRRLHREERLCRQCFRDVEDERHFLLECPEYKEVRKQFLDELEKDSPECVIDLKRVIRTDDDLDRQHEAISWAMNNEYRLVAQFIKKCNKIRRDLNRN